ncbi:uncharacterized protein F4807DRAFT_68827 [Annulohypoxylon truncatum]|uniref:uncharacterized protein n=1 Tax=Annulohypoxylon truncatum TaxID=327061 RepID=UPI002008E688|nr:uncharacterized protein F4807DRAFT_68827 [Annulohypoxylon truncatum]KAI1210052.1 hypothetical protein F4807DRAFT_68827 [Annulohypoxylon truncatum]
MSVLRRILQSLLPWLRKPQQPENLLQDTEAHVAESTSDDNDPLFDGNERLRGSGREERVNSGGNHSDHDHFIFYTPDPFNSNALTKAFMARNSQGRYSSIQVSTMKLLRSDARVGDKYTPSWQVEELEQRFSTTFEAIPDHPDEFQVVLGTERFVDVVEGQSCISSDQQPQSQSFTRDETPNSSNDQVQLGNSRVIEKRVPYVTPHSFANTHDLGSLMTKLSMSTNEGEHRGQRAVNGLNLREKIFRSDFHLSFNPRFIIPIVLFNHFGPGSFSAHRYNSGPSHFPAHGGFGQDRAFIETSTRPHDRVIEGGVGSQGLDI